MCDHTDNLDHADAWVQTVYCDCCGMPIGTETDTYPDKDGYYSCNSCAGLEDHHMEQLDNGGW